MKVKLTNLTWRKTNCRHNVKLKKRVRKCHTTSTNLLAWRKTKNRRRSRLLRRLVSNPLFASTSQKIRPMLGMTWLKVKFRLNPRRLVATLSSRSVTGCQRTTLRWLLMTIWWKLATSSVVMTTLPTRLSNWWFMKPLVGNHRSLATWA